MSIYHCSIKNISRSSGRSAVACAAYRSGEELEDLETGITHDYRKKTGIAFAEIFLCKNAPERFQNREELWNEVEKIEKAADARLAREIEVAIPRELSLEEMKNLVAGYAKMLTEEGMCVDANIHWKDGNHHAHIMGTTRPMTEVSAVKEECAKRERIAEGKAQEADRLKSHLKAVEADLSGQIDKKAQNLVESKLNALQGVYEAKRRSLDSEYKALTVSHEVFLFGCLLYGILVTVFTAIRSKAFTGDFKTFFIF